MYAMAPLQCKIYDTVMENLYFRHLYYKDL